MKLFSKHSAQSETTAQIEESQLAEMNEMLERSDKNAPKQVVTSNLTQKAKDRASLLKEKAKEQTRIIKDRLKSTGDQIKGYNLPLRLKHAYKKIKIKSLRALKEQNTFDSLPSDRLVSLTEKEWNKLWKRNRIGDYLPYWVFDEQTGIYVNNDNSYSILFECAPRIAMDGKTATSFAEIISKLPDNLILQIVLVGGSNNCWRIENWRQTHLKRAMENELLSAVINDLAKFFEQKHKEKATETMLAKLKSFRLFISLKAGDKNYNALIDCASSTKSILSTNGFAPVICHPERLTPVLYEALNGDVDPREIPEYTPAKELNRQLIGGESEFACFADHVRISSKANRRLDGKAKGKYWQALSPQTLPERAHIFDFGDKIGAKLSNAINANQFIDSFIISATVAKQPSLKTKAVRRNHSTNLQLTFSDALFRRRANIRKESVDILDRIDERREPLYSFDLDVLVSGDSYDQLQSNVASIKSYWRQGGNEQAIKLEAIPDVNQLAFLAALPMGANKEYIDTCGKSFSYFANQIAQFLPLEADYGGNGDNLAFATRRAALCLIDLFISNNNFNAYIVAGAGAGKSMLLQFIAALSYARGDRVVAIDIGRSQKRLCEELKGQYLEVDPLNPISFNPFSSIKTSEELVAEMGYLVYFCYALGANLNEAQAESEKKLIDSYLPAAIRESYNEKGASAEVTDVKNLMEKQDDPRCKDFARQMSSYCRGGLYEKFFMGESKANFNDDFIVVELQPVEDSPEIRDPIIMIALYHLNKSAFKSKSLDRKRLVTIIDEAHKFLGKNPRMDNFIEQAYRRYRKENGSILIATQSFSDIYSEANGLSRAGAAITSCSSWNFFLQQSESSKNLLVKSGIFGLSSYEEQLMRSVTTKKDEYSEIFMTTPDNLRLPIRLIVPRTFYWLTTSDPEDKKKLQRTMDQENVTIAKAIEIIVEREKAAKRRL
ncbi:MAG: TraC family protein [Helicobacteraceae bacterium]|jgi:conjugal transfer ATP-binding protein TraC|nr:TraC family protein [Helicobacteraceae bacterium]